MAVVKRDGSGDRVSFAKIREVIAIPNLIEIQQRSYEQFLQMRVPPQEREDQGLRSYPRLAPPPEVPFSLGLDRVTLRKLSCIFREALRRLPAEEEPGTIARQEVSVREKVEEILAGLAQRGRLSFGGLVSACRTRLEVIVSFLAVLELIKAQHVVAEQDRLFGDITLLPLEAEPASPAEGSAGG